MRLNIKLISQHILVVMTLHMILTFIHNTCVSKLNTDVMITNHSLMYQKYCPDVSNCITICISSAITHTALCNPRQRRLEAHDTIGRSYKANWVGVTDHTQRPESLSNQTQPPKLLIKSMEIPNINSCLLVDHTQSVKPLHVSEEKSNEHTFISPYEAHDTGDREDTWKKVFRFTPP